MSPGRLLVMQMPGYERGRPVNEVPELIRDEALARGMLAANIEIFNSPLAAARNALENARTGDVLVLLALTQRREVLDLVHGFIDG
jgi:UDP-N-acetylmuramyl tripeptide synthase